MTLISFWATTLLRALAAGTVVVLASALAEAAGAFWGALIISLPISSGPIYIIMAMDHDVAFIAGAALNGFAANAATGLFLIVYARLASRGGLVRSLGPAVLAWIVAAFCISATSWTPLTALLLNVAVYGAGAVLVKPTSETPQVRRTAISRRRSRDLLVRAVAVALFATAVSALSAALGPSRTGVVAAYPVTLTSTFVILHHRLGGPAMARLASITLRGVFGFGLTLLTVHLMAEPFGVPAALVGALLVSLVWSAGLLAVQHRRTTAMG